MRKALLTIVVILLAQLSFACTANFNYSAYPSGPSLLQYYFSNTSSYGSVTHPIYYNVIYFGDGTYSSISNTGYVMHNYSSPGTYSVKLVIRVIDSSTGTLSCADSITKSVTVSWPACGDSVYVSYGSGGAVTFTAHNPAGTTGITRTWYFGDGTYGYTNPITHTYTYNGTYSCYLTDTGSGGCTYTQSFTVNVTSGSWHCALDTARFSVGTSGYTASMYSTTRPPSGMHMQYKWNYGDGSSIYTSSAYYTNHTYSSTGTYTIKLYTLWVDSPMTTIYCLDSVTHSITIAGWSCSSDTARFTASVVGMTVNFNSPSRAPLPLSMIYKWDFGDGSSVLTTSSYAPSHTYTSTGTYSVKLKTQWYDTGAHSVICEDSITHSVTVGGYSCSNDTARFYAYSSSGLTWSFYSTSRAPSPLKMRYKWFFGDGGTYTAITTYTATHTYSTAGTYTVKLITEWYDTSTSSVVCSDSITHSITVTAPSPSSNTISGYIYKDTLYSPHTADYKVWLILYDSATHIIHAVDSTLDTGTTYTYYYFDSVAAGRYLVKAAITNGPTSGTGYVPTYHSTSAIWSTAPYVYYTSGATTGVNIIMQHGTVTGGPGFIAGDVRYGAGKGTAVGDPVQNLLIMVQDDAGTLVTSTYTDAAGHYSITDLPYGKYVVYPEQLGYNTTAWTTLNVNPFKTGYTDINFKETSTEIKPTTAYIGTVTSSQSFSIYPNPNNGKVSIQWDNTLPGKAIVQINNVTGQAVYYNEINLDNSGRSELNLSALDAGIYFINIVSGSTHYNEKLVIQK